jgi:hypothetical protein
MLHLNATVVVEVLLRGAVWTLFDKTKRTAGEKQEIVRICKDRALVLAIDRTKSNGITYSKNPMGARTPISFVGATEFRAEVLPWLAAGAKAEADPNKRAERRKRAIVQISVNDLVLGTDFRHP